MALIKLPVFDPRSTSRAFVAWKSAAAESARRSEISASINATLRAKTFDRSHLLTFATDGSCQIAVQILAALSGRPNEIVAALYSPPSERLRPYRFACIFGAIDRYDEAQPITTDTLRDIGTEATACALAACGIIDWKREKRTCPRAVFILRELIRRVRRS